MRVEMLRGAEGARALLLAYGAAAREFNVAVTTAIPIDGDGERMLVFTIGATTAAFTVEETRYLADMLIHRSGGMGSMSDDLETFGRLMLTIAADSPGPHGAH